MNKNLLYRRIPKVDVLLEQKTIQDMIGQYGRDSVMEAIREETDALRSFIASCEDETQALERIKTLVSGIGKRLCRTHTPNMRSVVNATGTILHTNLGRAPISEEHMKKAMQIATGYCNLEYNLEAGKRGERYSHFEALLCKLTGAEAAMAVNNNAASVMLILSSLAKGGEVIVSRGELIEIGGKFRIPDVMEQSGASLIEVGTTNKTHFDDYENAITEETRALLKVHTSNYRVVGFTDSVEIDELIPLARDYDIPVIEDLGSGVLIDLEKYGLTHEPTVSEEIARGADVVCFSGDKLLGGPQAGVIVGKKKYIDRMKKNQLTRALRIDKFTAAALELVLMEYLSEETAVKNIPALRMLSETQAEVEKRARSFVRMLRAAHLPAQIAQKPCTSTVGGGSLPLEELPSMAVTVRPDRISVPELESRMRRLPTPIVARVANDEILMDLRTVSKDELRTIAEGLKEILCEAEERVQ